VSPRHFALGLDLGQATDYSALCVCEDISDGSAGSSGRRRKTLHTRHLARFQLPYPEVVRRVRAYMDDPRLKGRAVLAVDATGVGRPVVDMMRESGFHLNQDFYGVLIHGGDKEHHDKGYWRVPKRDLVFAAQVALQEERLKFASGMELLPALVEELRNFRVKINPATAHDSYSHWREGMHDDLVLAVSLACWVAGKAGTTSSPIILRRESYWKGADGSQGAARPPTDSVGGWHQDGEKDMALNIYRKGDWS
jgi:hypothetical protein